MIWQKEGGGNGFDEVEIAVRTKFNGQAGPESR
jgi:hypothetical protein